MKTHISNLLLFIAAFVLANAPVTEAGMIINSYRYAASGGTFSPSDIAGLKLWLIGDNAPTGAVATWSDSSGNLNNATAIGVAQPTGVASVINGHQVVRFDGVNDIMSLTTGLSSNASYTLIAVMKKRVAGASLGALMRNGDYYTFGLLAYTNGEMYMTNGTQYSSYTGINGQATTWEVWTAINSGGTMTMYRHGSSAALGSILTGGSNRAFDSLATYPATPGDGDIAEIIYYDSALDASTRALVESYEIAKYGL